MKKIYLLGVLTAAALSVACTRDSKELDILKEPTPTPPVVSNPPVDLSKTIVSFSPSEISEKVFRDPNTKLIEDTSFSFAPKYLQRVLATGESVTLKIEKEQVGYERSLPDGAYTVEKAEISSANAGEQFKVTLKPEALKEIDITKEYTLRFRMKIASKTPQDLAVEAATDDGAYRIKISFVEDSFPKDGNNLQEIENTSSPTINDDDYEFESNYAENHLNKLKNSYSNWWVDGEDNSIYLIANFTDETEVNGIVISQPRSDIKTLEGVDISASPDGTTYYPQGSYTRSSYKQKIYLKFKKPIKVKKIKFTNFKKHNDRYIDIYRVQFF